MSQQPTLPLLSNQPMPQAYGFVQRQGEEDDRRSVDEGSEDGKATDVDAEINIKLKEMSTKTLTNLASYPNPMQKAAQQILTRARQAPPSMQQQAPDSMQDTRGLLPPYGSGPRNIHSDPATMGSQLQSDRTDEYGLNRPFRPFNQHTSEFTMRERDSYPAVLSKGPGAPLPLTAGPPGQRQLQPSAFNPMNTLQKESSTFGSNAWRNESPEFAYSTNPWAKNAEPSRGVEPYANVPRTHPNPPFQASRPTQPGPQKPTQLYMNDGFPSYQPSAMNQSKTKDHNSSSKIVDTLTYEEAKKFYPNGFPADFNYDTQPVPDNWAELRLKEVEDEKHKNQLSFQQRPEFQTARKERLRRNFYAGGNMISKDLDVAIHEENSRNIARALGSPLNEPERPAGRIVNRHLSVEEANEIPTHEHAKPLLSVLYQSMAAQREMAPSPPSPYLPKRDGPTQQGASPKRDDMGKYGGSR
ncbi:hypothetical protein F5Y05DRAFT_387329 [Hypoxylon sp. FL0543]|nr:hypothetical protein F5Y05DRAFT_387329 [Hypoxylon sp. FL0543]